jgi:hypothetical protein
MNGIKIFRLEETPLLLHGEITTYPPAIAEAAKFRSSLVVRKFPAGKVVSL